MAESKALLRGNMKAVLRAIPAAQWAYKSERLFEKLVDSSEYGKCHSISIYLNTPHEPHTLPIIKESLHHGKRVFVPQVIPKHFQSMHNLQGNDTGMCMHRVMSMEQIDHWPLNRWHIREPPPFEKWEDIIDEAVDTGGLDLIIVPGLAFTNSGQRLGRGMGYYDRYLQWLRTHAEHTRSHYPTTIGLAFTEQILDEVPTEPHDVIIDKIISA